MRVQRIVQATLLILFSMHPLQGQNRQKPSSTSSIKVDVNLVLVPVTVTDSENRFVEGLQAQHFQIWEDKVEQKIEYLSSETTPLSLALVFDISGSMRDKLSAARDAAATCLNIGNPEDEYSLVEFSNQAQIAQDFTPDISRLQSKLTLSSAKGSTALLDAVYLGLEKVRLGSNRRKALLLITDGEDNHSRYTFSNVKEFLKESEAQLYAIGIVNAGSFRSSGDGRALLGDLTDMSGGRAFFLNSIDHLEDVCTKISLELKSQYVLGYISTNSNTSEKWRKLRVKVDPPTGLSHLHVRAKDGYVAGPDR
jgi:Ca-activated chloride channel family protein